MAEIKEWLKSVDTDNFSFSSNSHIDPISPHQPCVQSKDFN